MADQQTPTIVEVLQAFIEASGGISPAASRLGTTKAAIHRALSEGEVPLRISQPLAVALGVDADELATENALFLARKPRKTRDPDSSASPPSAPSSSASDAAASPLRSLREALNITQDDLVKRSGGLLSQSMLSRAESGLIQLSSVRLRVGLAHALGVERSAVDDFLDGLIGAEGLAAVFKEEQELRDAANAVASSKPLTVNRRSLDDRRMRSKDLLAIALGQAFRAADHSIDDIDTIRRLSKEATTIEDVPDDLLSILAGVWLDAAARHRRSYRFDPSTADILTTVTATLIEDWLSEVGRNKPKPPASP